MQEKKDNVVVIWTDGFPHKHSAFNEKNSLLAKALILANYVVILTSKSSCGKYESENSGITEKIFWQNFCRNQIRSRLIRSLLAVLSEIRFIICLKKKYKNVFLISSYYPFAGFLFYSLICTLFKVKLVLNIMEWHIAVFENSSVTKRIDAYLFDKYAVRLSKGTIAISELIISNLKQFSQKSKFLLVPALTDTHKIDEVQASGTIDFPYFLYCAGMGYAEVIEMIIDSFEECCKSEGNKDIHLVLVLHGKKSQFETLKGKIATKANSNKVHILNDISYADLIRQYKNASALLVPLRDSIQDKARYPQKIAEYAACGRPIISNATGQVGLDFKHKYDIHFMASYSSTGLANAMKEVLENKNMALTISYNARLKAETYFDFKIYSHPLDNFLKRL